MNAKLKAVIAVAGLAAATQAMAQVTFYDRPGMRGQSFTVDGTVPNFDPLGYNDRASSAVVRNGQWQVCEHADFGGHCVVLQPGDYPRLGDIGMGNQISSARPIDNVGSYRYNDRRYAYDDQRRDAYGNRDEERWRRRHGERVFEVPVTDVRAIYGPPEQRCWVERQDVGGGANVPGAVIGGVIGGILGHQIGRGTGNDIATIGGAAAGAAIGGNVNRGGAYTQDVQRCADVSTNGPPDYYDVTYHYRGQEHHVAMTSPPGSTILVNRDGEPRE